MSGIRSIRPVVGAKPGVRPEALVKPLRFVPVQRVLDFDTDAAGGPIPDGGALDILNPYLAHGVTFSARGAAAGGHACAKLHSVYKPAHSGANILALRLPANHARGPILVEDINEDYGILRADFAVTARRVAIQVAACTPSESFLQDRNAYQGRTPYLKAFDENGALLGTAQMAVGDLPPLQPGGSACSAYVELAVTAADGNISHVEFSCRPMAAGMDRLKVFFDTLSFEVIEVVRS